MKICMLSTSHPPNDDRIYYKESRTLSQRYGPVTFVYPDSGKLPPADDSVRFVPFERDVRSPRRLRSIALAYRFGMRERADVYHCHEPESLVAGAMLKRALGARLVFDSHEMYAGVLAGRLPRFCWRGGEWIFGQLEASLIRQCDAAIGATWAIGDYLRRILGMTRVEVLLNVPVAEVFGEVTERQWGTQTVLCHDGCLTFDRGLRTMVEAVRLAALKHDVVFRIVGDVYGAEREWLDAFVTRHNLQGRIVRTGWLPYEEVGQAIGLCHIGLLAFRMHPNHVIAMPNKIFNYLMYGLPFVGPSFATALQRMQVEDGCCLLADPGSPDSYATAIGWMIDNRERTIGMAANALRASRQKFRWQHMEPLLLGLYERLESGVGRGATRL